MKLGKGKTHIYSKNWSILDFTIEGESSVEFKNIEEIGNSKSVADTIIIQDYLEVPIVFSQLRTIILCALREVKSSGKVILKSKEYEWNQDDLDLIQSSLPKGKVFMNGSKKNECQINLVEESTGLDALLD